VVKHLLSKCNALSSNPVPPERKEKIRKNGEKKIKKGRKERKKDNK
jgi:hypothetical protein